MPTYSQEKAVDVALPQRHAAPYASAAHGGSTARYSRHDMLARRSYQQRRRGHLRRRRRLGILCALVIAALLAAGILYAWLSVSQGQHPSLTTPEELVQLFDRNPEARQFVLDYDEHHDDQPPIELSELAHAQTVPLLLQFDERWGYSMYAGQHFAVSGCGPSCLSMVYIYLTGDTSMSPLAMAQFASDRGYAVDCEGSLWTLISQGGSELGLDVTEIPLDKERVKANLEAGNPIICIMGPGDFTRTGHFIILAGWSDRGIVIRDPNSRERSDKLWSYDQLAGQIKDLWVLRKG